MGRGTVLVTGGAGYVGSHACKALAEAGFTPVAYDNLSTGNRWAVRWGPLEAGDILDPSALHLAFKRHRPVAVMHFAGAALVGESMREPALYWRQNLAGTLNLVEACRIHEVGALVFSSTCAVYGTPEQVPIDEDTPKAPINPYGASKLAVERLLADAAMAYGLRYAALRYFNAAGADPAGEIGEHRPVETHLIPLLLDAILGLRPPLQVLGTDYPTPDGTAIRDYVHVADLAVAHVRALEHLLLGGGSFACNLGTGEGHSVRRVIEAAERVTGRPVPRIEAPRRPGDPPVLVADARRAQRELGLLPSNLMGLERILETAWAWHAEHRPRRLSGG
ncbi:MAG: UDP-glucose 4-epimerase GalE [Geminicoccaceae bacterium]|nr:UDP-glucose 4-epimerase GalE [Geminicoccaceae bacterium]